MQNDIRRGSLFVSAFFLLVMTEPLARELVSGEMPQFARIEAGQFSMGEETGRVSDRHEGPRHLVRITRPFDLSITEVTRGQFRAFVEATGYVTEAERDPMGGFVIDEETARPQQHSGVSWRNPGFHQTDDHPVVQVSWIDAEAYCEWLSGEEARLCRLPTEAEWEFACRAGTESRYWFGDDPADLEIHGNIADTSLGERIDAIGWHAPWTDAFPFTAPVGSFKPNPLGLYDMHGNVWEWCSDWFDREYYQVSPGADPSGPQDGVIRSIRGGGWYDGVERCRAATRIWFRPEFRYCQLSGFRVVREVATADR